MDNKSYAPNYEGLVEHIPIQKNKDAFRLLLQTLKDLGYLDKPNPIIRLKFIKSWPGWIEARLNVKTLRNNEKFGNTFLYCDPLLFHINSQTGEIGHLLDRAYNHIIWQVARARWGDLNKYLENIHRKTRQERTVLSQYIDTLPLPLSDTIILLGEMKKVITDEITRQGYKATNKHIANLLYLSNMNTKHDDTLVGELKDWIPYVCAGLTIGNLYELLYVKHNVDYAKTGKIAISVETAKNLYSLHTNFRKLLMQS